MVDGTKLKPTPIEKGGIKHKRGVEMVVITQQQKAEYSSQLEVEPIPTLPPRLNTKVETPIHDSIRELVTWECKEHGVKS
jgi:hypothetical protein